MESVGGAHLELGDFDRAADWFGRALAQCLARDDRAGAARLHGRIAAAHTYAGRYGEALRSWRAAVTGYRKSGDVAAQARALSEVARVQEYAGRPEESLETCHEAVELARGAEDVRLQAALQLRLADTLERLGDPASAQLHRGSAERLLGGEASQAEEPAEESADVEDSKQDGDACEIRSARPED
jgi:tetratricopeptide (TPR) repeat protein